MDVQFPKNIKTYENIKKKYTIIKKYGGYGKTVSEVLKKRSKCTKKI